MGWFSAQDLAYSAAAVLLAAWLRRRRVRPAWLGAETGALTHPSLASVGGFVVVATLAATAVRLSLELLYAASTFDGYCHGFSDGRSPCSRNEYLRQELPFFPLAFGVAFVATLPLVAAAITLLEAIWRRRSRL
ncbi:MAG TPA: hypothetical protein VNG33_22920 [Polyangiaceae bacterium]|nr:hypothetical protein [Polyangiaceae bacterium]